MDYDGAERADSWRVLIQYIFIHAVNVEQSYCNPGDPGRQRDEGPTGYGTPADSFETSVKCILSLDDMLTFSIVHGVPLRSIGRLRISETNRKLKTGVPGL